MRSKSVELLKIRRFDRLPSEETNSTPKHNQISSLGTHAPQCRCNSKNIFKRTYTNLLKPKDNFQGCFQAKKWTDIVNPTTNDNEMYELLNQTDLETPNFCDASCQIFLDVGRTYPDIPYFSKGIGKVVLKRMLLAFAKYNPTLGYVQGMNLIAANLLWHTTEIHAFWLFVHIMSDYDMTAVFLPNFPGLETHCHIADYILIEHLPNLYGHFSKHGIATQMIILDWCLTLYMSLIPLDQSYLLLHKFFKEKWIIFYKLFLEIFSRLESKILSCHNIAGIINLFKKHQKTSETWKKFLRNLEKPKENLTWEKLICDSSGRKINEGCLKFLLSQNP